MSDSYPRVEVTSRAEWRAWLAANHESSTGIWLVTHKKSEGERYGPYDAVAEEAIAFGWIDGSRRGIDERRTELLITPRRPKSGWSRVNKRRVEELEASGLMTDAGRAVIERAKGNGSWSALDDVENLVEPDDLRAALDGLPPAREHWNAFPRSAKRAILEWVGSAKRPETRERRVTETTRLAAENVRANQPSQPKRR